MSKRWKRRNRTALKKGMWVKQYWWNFCQSLYLIEDASLNDYWVLLSSKKPPKSSYEYDF